MYFFLSAGIGQRLTGIEHAVLRRGKIFTACAMDYKIVTLNHNPNYLKNLNAHGISENNFLNLYDSFQKIIFATFKENTLHHFISSLSGNIRIEKTSNSDDVRVYINDVYTFYIHSFSHGQISYINYFDGQRVKLKREVFTEHGWLSKVIYLENNAPKQVHYLDSQSNVVLEECYDKDNVVSIFILHHLSKKNFFYNKDDLTKYWLQWQFSLYESSVVYSDKNKLYNDILITLEKSNFKLISVFHSVHVRNPKDLENSKINSNYQSAIDNKDKFDGFIVATENQKNDIHRRLGQDMQIWAIPPAYADTKAMVTTTNTDFNVISVGRYYVEKRLHHIIEAVELLKEKYPDILLHLYGFGDSRDNYAYENKIRSYVKDHQLEKNVLFEGYSQQILSHLSQATVSVMTSTVEGFCIGILDSLAVATPVVAYDIKYGPANMLQHEYSGFLVEEDNIPALAAAIEKCYLNKEIRKNVANSIEKYSFNSLKKTWLNHLFELSNT